MATKLSPTMTPAQYDNGYWYAADLKRFAKRLGIGEASKLRKDELETAIKNYLKNGNTNFSPKRMQHSSKPRRASGTDDIAVGLSLKLPVVNYNGNKFTKDFIVREACKQMPGLKERSGVRYRLNRWREDQLTAGRKLCYGDLVQQDIALNQTEAPFIRVPTGRYINFLAEFAKNEPRQTREAALKAWHQLKTLNVPKTYTAWRQHNNR